MKRCVLHAEKICNDCGECDDRCELDPQKICDNCGECDDRCELDPQKICDNCFRCLESDARPFAEIPISGVFFDDDYSPEGERLSDVDLNDAYVLDLDERWKDGPLVAVKTLPESAYASRVRRRHRRDRN